MTRKDYKIIAAAFWNSSPPVTGRGWKYGWDVWRQSVYVMADALQSDNPRFDRAKFLYAAGI